MTTGDFTIFAGTVNAGLAEAVARFPDGETSVSGKPCGNDCRQFPTDGSLGALG